MRKLSSISITASAYVILVSIIILAFVELSQSCHRRVEYHHFYKKKPHEGQEQYGYGGHGQTHGHGGYGHGAGGGHKGHPQGHGKGYVGGYKGHTGGYKGHSGGHGSGGGYKGYSQVHGGGHKGYGQPHGGGYDHKHYGGGGQDHYGGGHSGGSHKGYGTPSYGGLHGMGHGQEYGGGSQGHHDEGYGHGHEMYGYGMAYPEPLGHHEYVPDPGYGQGHHNDAYGGGQTYGQDPGKGHGSGEGTKGRKYKYQMYEMTHYNDKGSYQQPNHGQTYSQSAPAYMPKGYGYSGPYPNTEYSTPVETSVNAPKRPIFYSVDDIEGTSNVGSRGSRLPPQLDAATTADLIRNVYNPKDNQEMVHNPTGNLAPAAGGVGGQLSDNNGMQNNDDDDYNAVDALAAFTSQIAPIANSRGEVLTETKVSPTSNFDLNLNFNSGDLPAPFRRNAFESTLHNGGRIRKKLSSKYRDNPSGIGLDSDSSNEDAENSQSHPVPSGPDYLENDTSASSLATKTSEPGDIAKMNF